jgi:hypothetical protein
MSMILPVTLSSAGRFERARIYTIQFTGEGRPAPAEGPSPSPPSWPQRTSV